MKKQTGSTFIGIVIGLTLAIGLIVALLLWLSKAKMPVINKVQGNEVLNTLDELTKNKNWDPNAQLLGKAPPPSLASRGASAVSDNLAPVTESQSDVIDKVVNSLQNTQASNAISPAPNKPKTGAELAEAKTIGVGVENKAVANDKAIARDQAENNSTNLVKPNSKNTVGLASSPIAASSLYSVQVGAFKSKEDASAQKARLALMGIETKITEVEQGGKTIYRVRSSSMSQQDAQGLKNRLDKASVENGLVKLP